MGAPIWLALLPRAIESPTLWIGTALLIVSFILFAAALSWADLSFVVPAVSMEVVVNVVFASYFLNEIVSLTRWTGVLLISIGVILVMRSERRKGAAGEARNSWKARIDENRAVDGHNCLGRFSRGYLSDEGDEASGGNLHPQPEGPAGHRPKGDRQPKLSLRHFFYGRYFFLLSDRPFLG